MRESSLPTQPRFVAPALPRAPLPPPTATLPDSPDPNFLRHQQALASQRTMTRPAILRPVSLCGSATISHW